MNPPVFAQALIAATAPSRDYEIISGDLYEEYGRIISIRGLPAANRWYWAQTLVSLLSLISYGRPAKSSLQIIGVALISLTVLIAMLVVITAIDTVFLNKFDAHGISRYLTLSINYGSAIVFGAVLARIVRTDGPRIAFFASLFLVLCFVIPALAGNPHSQVPAAAWIELCGMIPMMCIGAAAYQAAKRRVGKAH